MEKFSFKDVLILFAGTIITIGIAWVLLTVTGFVPREIGKLFFEDWHPGLEQYVKKFYQYDDLGCTYMQDSIHLLQLLVNF